MYDTITVAQDYVGKRVRYDGDSRRAELQGLVGKVVRANERNVGSFSLGVEFPGITNLVWAESWAWEIMPDEIDVDKAFTQAVGGPREKILAEIKITQERLDNLNELLGELDKVTELIMKM